MIEQLSNPDSSHNTPFAPPVPTRSSLAVLACILACIGPLALLVMVVWYPPFRTDDNPLGTPPRLAEVVVWTLGLMSPVGVVLGIITWIYIRRSGGWITGDDYSITGIIVGLLASLILFQGSIALNNWRAQPPRDSMSCMSNVKQLSLAFEMYVQDYDGYFPLRQTWNEAIYPYTKNLGILRCPLEVDRTLPSYALNASLSLYKYNDVARPAQTPMIFDSIPGQNRAGWTELLPSPPRDYGTDTIGFADGHVKPVHPADINDLIWHLPHGGKAGKPAAKRTLDKRP